MANSPNSLSKQPKKPAVPKTSKTALKRKAPKPRSTNGFWNRFWTELNNGFAATFRKTPPIKQKVFEWLHQDQEQVKHLLLSALKFNIDLAQYLPNYEKLITFQDQKVKIRKAPALTLAQAHQITQVDLSPLTQLVIQQHLQAWEKANTAFFRSFMRLKINPTQIIPYFDEFYTIIAGQIIRREQHPFNLTKVRALVATTAKIDHFVQTQLRQFLQKWVNRYQTLLVAIFRSTINKFFQPEFLPETFRTYLVYSDQTVTLLKKHVNYQIDQVFKLLDFDQLQLEKLKLVAFRRNNLLNKLDVWFINNFALLKKIRSLKIPLSLVSSELEKYLDFPNLKLRSRFIFTETAIQRIWQITNFHLRQVINHHLMREWVKDRTQVLLKWHRAQLPFTILLPDLPEKLVVQADSNRILVNESAVIPEPLIRQVTKISVTKLENALAVFQATKSVEKAQKIFLPPSLALLSRLRETSKFWKQVVFMKKDPIKQKVFDWLHQDQEQVKYLLLSALKFNIDLAQYLPNYEKLITFQNQKVKIRKAPTLTLAQVHQITQVDLSPLIQLVIQQHLQAWEKANAAFFRSFMRLRINPTQIIPYFDEFYTPISGQITRREQHPFNLTKVRTLVATTAKIDRFVQTQLRQFLQKWVNRYQTLLIAVFRSTINKFFQPEFLPQAFSVYLAYSNETVTLLKKRVNYQIDQVFKLLDFDQPQLEKLKVVAFQRNNLLNKLDVWFINNFALLKKIRNLKIPLSLVSSELEKYFDFPNLKLRSRFIFVEAELRQILQITNFNLRQVVNHYFMRQWMKDKTKVLLEWHRAQLPFTILFPDLPEKLVVQADSNRILVNESAVIPELLIRQVTKISVTKLENALAVFQATKSVEKAQKIFVAPNILQMIWRFFSPTKAVLKDAAGAEIFIGKKTNLGFSNWSRQPLHDIIAYKNNQKEYKNLIKTYSKKILRKKQIVGVFDADIDQRKYIIEAHNVGKYFIVDKKVNRLFYNLSLKIKKNDFVVVLGPSGSGKTSLLNILSGLDRADIGDVFCSGVNLTLLSNDALTVFRRSYVSFVFQDYNLLPNLTAFENVEIGAYLLPKNRAPFDIYELFSVLQIDAQKNSYPSQMSGGQQQRVAIARALAKHPQILFCDEPTGALDQKMSKKVLQILLDINKHFKMTIILITHNVEFAKIANSVIHFKDGEIQKYESNKKPLKIEDLNW